jgi:hypothetical protein
LHKTKHTQTDGKIYLAHIIDEGFKIYQAYKNLSIQELRALTLFDHKELIEIYYYIYAINQILGGSKNMFYVWKDTTCSMAQHAGKLLGYKIESLELLNLDNKEYAIDTYQIYINHIKTILAQSSTK